MSEEWRMEKGEWRMENGEWRMENGERRGDELVRLCQFNSDWAISLVGPSFRWHRVRFLKMQTIFYLGP